MDFVTEWLAQIGIEIEVKTVISEDQLTEAVTTGEFDLFEWGWVVEPDPDFQLSYLHLRPAVVQGGGTIQAGLSGSATRSTTRSTSSRRRRSTTPSGPGLVKADAEAVSTTTSPYLVEYYYDDLQAYRSDKFTGGVPQPRRRAASCCSSTASALPHHHAGR